MSESSENEYRRLFFGCEVSAPWPDSYPKGRLIDEAHRHLTLVFLGKTHYPTLQEKLNRVPHPLFFLGPVGIFQDCLFLPKRHPNVVAWGVTLLEMKNDLVLYRNQLSLWLLGQGFKPDMRHKDFLPHVSICRGKFSPPQWKKHFQPLPMKIHSLHLLESLGQSVYHSLWSHPFLEAFKEIEHTADVAYLVRGKDPAQLQLHAFMALTFLFPDFIDFLPELTQPEDLDSIIVNLNDIVSRADATIGCPLKAVSYHGSLEKNDHQNYEWTMIVDV